MIRLGALFWLVLVVAAGFVTFKVKYAVQDIEDELNRVRKQLGEQNIELKVTDDAMELLATRGYDHNFGARPLRRIIQNLIEDPLAEGMLEQRFLPDTDVYVTVDEGLLKLNSQDEYEAAEAAEAANAPAKKSRKKAGKGEDLEPELSGAGAGSDGTSTKE